jgi:hypothetical protein
MRTATARAIRDTQRFARTLVKRDIAKNLGVPQKAINKRLVTPKISNRDIEGKVWAGTWDISPFALGTPSQSEQGVRGIPKRNYKGAFLARVFSQELGVGNIWIRLKSRHFDPKLYPYDKRKNRGSVPDELKHRFPVVKASIPAEEAMTKAFDQDEEQIRQRFLDRLSHQADYILKKGGLA